MKHVAHEDRELLTAEVLEAHRSVEATRRALDEAVAARAAVIRRAVGTHGLVREIARELGVGRQRVHQMARQQQRAKGEAGKK